jgi:two-component system chemotaxis sensor kinase CheA
MSFQEDDLQEILTIFKGETEEHLQKLNEGILALEKDPGRKNLIEEVFREAHNIKGAARMIGFEEVEKLAHSLEDIFNEARKDRYSLKGEVSDILLECLDLINRMISDRLIGKDEVTLDVDGYLERQRAVVRGTERKEGPSGVLEGKVSPSTESGRLAERWRGERKKPARSEEAGPGEAGVGTGSGEPAHGKSIEKKGVPREPVKVAPSFEETIRVSVDKLDELMAQVGEILVSKIRSDERLKGARGFLGHLADFQKDWHRLNHHLVSRSRTHEETTEQVIGFIRENTSRLDDLLEEASRLSEGLAEENLRLESISGNIQESVNQVRMLPMSAIFNYFPRLVRDIGREEGKEVELTIRGAETKLDKRILEELKDPLTHLLRNSIEHGLESIAERKIAGKTEHGRITLSAYQKGSNVVVDLEDDGYGIDPEKIKAIGLQRGFITEEELSDISHSQLMQLIFQPGFSSKSIITDLSGRGIGLDVVLTSIERLKGTISTSSVIGEGTRFSIKLPLTLATTQALIVKAGGQKFAIPLTAVEYTGEVDLEGISTLEGRETVLIGDRSTDIIKLVEILGLDDTGSEDNGAKIPLVVLFSADDRVAFTVDDLVSEGEIVLKSFGSQLVRVPNVAGATLLADGTPVVILNFFDLIKSARMARGLWIAEKMKNRERKKTRFTVMVVDDSITTRTLEKNVLESNDYKVVTAVDGADALDQLKTKKVDLVVSDIQMPKMDGFELTSTIRGEKDHRHLPVVLVTSLESEEDKEKGVKCGADAYITKGIFNQGNLLNTLKQLL